VPKDPRHELSEFEKSIVSYGEKVGDLLTQKRWAFWCKYFWTYGHWIRADPELQKILTRLYSATDELLRLLAATAAEAKPSPEVSEAQRKRIDALLQVEPVCLTLNSALEVFDALDRILIEIGDARFVCEEIHGELQRTKGGTTWLTWYSMYSPGTVPEAVETYLQGGGISDKHLDAARHQLSSFRRARSDQYQVHRARQRMRAKNLGILGALLLPLVAVLGWLLADQVPEIQSPRQIALIAVAGALGAAISGTIKARDKLVRGSDLRAFRAGLLAQVLLGAASALLIFLLLKAKVLEIIGTASLEGQTALGFVAGFSEPFVLRTIERVAKMGEEKAGERSGNDQ